MKYYVNSIPPRKKPEYKSKDIMKAWRRFLFWAKPYHEPIRMGIFNEDGAVPAHNFYLVPPRDDGWDRMRIRIEPMAPKSLKAKIIEEIKSGRRHVRAY